MGIVNRRNAVLGWTAWRIAKRVMKQRARRAVPGGGDGGSSLRGRIPALVSAVAVLGAALWFWRRSADDEETDFSE